MAVIDTGPLQKDVGSRLPGGPAPTGSLPAWRYRAAAKSKVAGVEADTAAPTAQVAAAKVPRRTIAAAATVPERWAPSAPRPAGYEGASIVSWKTTSTEGLTDSGQDSGGKDSGRLLVVPVGLFAAPDGTHAALCAAWSRSPSSHGSLVAVFIRPILRACWGQYRDARGASAEFKRLSGHESEDSLRADQRHRKWPHPFRRPYQRHYFWQPRHTY